MQEATEQPAWEQTLHIEEGAEKSQQWLWCLFRALVKSLRPKLVQFAWGLESRLGAIAETSLSHLSFFLKRRMS